MGGKYQRAVNAAVGAVIFALIIFAYANAIFGVGA